MALSLRADGAFLRKERTVRLHKGTLIFVVINSHQELSLTSTKELLLSHSLVEYRTVSPS